MNKGMRNRRKQERDKKETRALEEVNETKKKIPFYGTVREGYLYYCTEGSEARQVEAQ